MDCISKRKEHKQIEGEVAYLGADRGTPRRKSRRPVQWTRPHIDDSLRGAHLTSRLQFAPCSWPYRAGFWRLKAFFLYSDHLPITQSQVWSLWRRPPCVPPTWKNKRILFLGWQRLAQIDYATWEWRMAWRQDRLTKFHNRQEKWIHGTSRLVPCLDSRNVGPITVRRGSHCPRPEGHN